MLKRSHDRKTTIRAGKLKESHKSRIANAFALPSGTGFSCPGATKVCESVCYAGRIEKRFPQFLSLAMHNWEILKDQSSVVMALELANMINEFAEECEKYGVPKYFRWHVDGDIFNGEYALALAATCRTFTDVQFWLYTRSFQYVKHITGIPNLTVYLSVDSENESAAVETKENHPGVHLAYLSDSFEKGKEWMMNQTNKPGAKCPENSGQIPLITKDGGACVTCGLCIFGKADIRFSSSGK